MPTAPKLIAGILFAALAWFVSDLFKSELPEGSRVDWLSPINAGVGFLMGWRISGTRAGAAMKAAMGYGLTTAAAIVFWCLLIWSAYLMVVQSTRMRYDGPVAALQDMALKMVEYGQMIALRADIVGSLIVGALIFGWITEQVARRYP